MADAPTTPEKASAQVPANSSSAQTARIGIIGAMDVEVELLEKAMEKEGSVTRIQAAAKTCLVGRLGNMPVAVAQCDVGMVNAAMFAQMLIDRAGVCAIVNTGVAGSLDASIDIGDIVVATDAVNHIMDVANLGYEPGQTPGLGSLSFACDERLRAAAAAAARDLNIPAHEGRIASGDRFVRDASDKERIAQTFDARCCEMEGAAIAQVCQLNSVPCAIVRAISDKADGTDHIDYPTFELTAAHRCAALVTRMLQLLD